MQNSNRLVINTEPADQCYVIDTRSNSSRGGSRMIGGGGERALLYVGLLFTKNKYSKRSDEKN